MKFFFYRGPGKHCPRRGRGGFSLIDLMVAMVILAVALVGVIGLILAVQTHNQSFSDSRLAYKASQEVMEQLLRLQYTTMRAQNGIRFEVPNIHQTAQIGVVRIRDAGPPLDPTSITEIEVIVDTQGVGLKPLRTSLVSRRTSK
jgi:type II secretory pathway pseudopilin PulG